MSESSNHPPDPLDRLLAISLPRQPEPQPVANLAERAIQRARSLDRSAQEQRRRLARIRWRLRFVYGVAVILIGILVVIGGHRLLTQRRAMTSSDTAAVSSSESTTASTSIYFAWLGGVLFICTLAGLATESAMARTPASMV